MEPVLSATLGGIPVSVDTSKAAVARRALELGAMLVNDVTALRGDPELAGVVADSDAYLCLMHMLGEPRTCRTTLRYDDVVSRPAAVLEERLGFAVRAGIAEERMPRSRDQLRQDDGPQPRAPCSPGRDRGARAARARRRLAEAIRPGRILGPRQTLSRARSRRESRSTCSRSSAVRRSSRVHDVPENVEALAAAARSRRWRDERRYDRARGPRAPRLHGALAEELENGGADSLFDVELSRKTPASDKQARRHRRLHEGGRVHLRESRMGGATT